MTAESSIEERLDAFLDDMPIDDLNKLVRELERTSLRGIQDETMALIVQCARNQAQKRKMRLQRFPTPFRMFVTPLEPFLTEMQVEEKQVGRIARTSLSAMWEWLRRDLIADQLADYEERTSNALLKDELSKAQSIIQELQQTASAAIEEAMQKADRDSKEYMRWAARIGGEQKLEDARDIARILKHMEKLKNFSRALPKSIDELGEDDLDWLKTSVAQLGQEDSALITYALAVLMSKLRSPAQVLRLAVHATGSDKADKVARGPLKEAGELVLHDIAAAADAVSKALSDPSKYSKVRTAMSRYYRLAHDMRMTLEMSGADEWSKRLGTVRAELSAALEAQIRSAPRLIRTNLAPRNSGERFPEPDELEIEAAELAINLLEDARVHISELALNDLVASLGRDINAFLNHTSDSLAARLRNIEPYEAPKAAKVLASAVRLIRAALGDEMADLLEQSGERAIRGAGSEKAAKAS